MKISVIIVTYNRVPDLRVALNSVVQQKVLPYEVIVVDQSENSSTKELLDEFKLSHSLKGPKFIYTHMVEKGAARARNVGLRLCAGEIISFLDDDVSLSEDYYEKVLRYFRANPGLGGISGNILNLESFRGWKWELRKKLLRLFLINNFDGKMTASGFGYVVLDQPLTVPTEVEFLHGCDMNFRFSAIKDKRFDEWFTGYSYREDADFSYGIAQHYKLLLVPDARLLHHVSPRNRLNSVSLKKMQFTNYYYIFKKYKNKNRLSVFIFYYSLTGYVFMDLIKFLLSLRKIDGDSFLSGLSAYWNILSRDIRGLNQRLFL